MFRRLLLTVLLCTSSISAQSDSRQKFQIVPEINPNGAREALVLLIASLLLIAPPRVRARKKTPKLEDEGASKARPLPPEAMP